MGKDVLNKVKDKFILVFVLVLFYGGLQLVGITCPIKYLTGISCAGCGMTRAWMALILHQDPMLALSYHPLFWMVIPAGILYLLRSRMFGKLWKRILWVIVSVAMAVYLWRMFAHTGEVVVFEPQNGLIGRVILWVIPRIDRMIG